jgi:hypothetical protein
MRAVFQSCFAHNIALTRLIRKPVAYFAQLKCACATSSQICKVGSRVYHRELNNRRVQVSRGRSKSQKKKASLQKRKPRLPRYSSLTEREKSAYDRTTNFITDRRRGEGPVKKLLRKHHLSSPTARKYGGRDLIGGANGPLRASKSDRRVRDVWFPKAFGDVPIRTRSSRDATKLSEFFHDRDNLFRGKLSAVDFESKWRGVHVAGQELFSDVAAILDMADADVLNIENLYASTTEDR